MKLIRCLLLLLAVNQSYAQLIGEGEYANFSKKLRHKGIYHLKDKQNNCSQKIDYLGTIISTNNHPFKVLTSHKNLVGKGVNDIVFISEEKVEYVYRVNLPSDFPFNISNNKLDFKNSEKATLSMSIEQLTNLFCTPIECFEKI
jgi:hypothetical protein